MSLANLGIAYQNAVDSRVFAEHRARVAEDQMNDFCDLLAKWFVDSDEGAREWLREVALAHREEHPKETPCAT